MVIAAIGWLLFLSPGVRMHGDEDLSWEGPAATQTT